MPEGAIAQPSAPQFSSSQGGHVRMPLTKTARRNANPNSDGKPPLGDRDHVARITRHR